MRVLAVTPPDCYLDPDWKPAGVTLLTLEADLPDQIDDASLEGADLLMLAGFISGPTLLRALTRLLQRYPAQRVVVVASDATVDFDAAATRLGIGEIWPNLSEQRLRALTASFESGAGETDASALAPPPQRLDRFAGRGAQQADRLPPEDRSRQLTPPPPAAAPLRAATRAGSEDTGAGRPGLSIGVMSAKGGDGGSFVAANLATCLARASEGRALLIDLALPFGDVEMFLELHKPQYDLADFCEDTSRLDRELFEMMTLRMSSGLHFIPPLRALDRFGAIVPERIEGLIRRAAMYYRHIVIDLGSGITPVGLDLMRLVDQLAVVATPTVPSLRKASQILGIWERIGREPHRLLAVGNRMARKWDLTAEEFEEALRQRLAWQLPNVPEALNQAVMAGQPLVQHAPRSPMTAQLERWAAELGGGLVQKPKESLWQRLMNL